MPLVIESVGALANAPQLAKENSKFIYGAIREGARGRGYEEAIEWLVSARMVRRVRNLDAIEYPLSAHDVRNAFKLYLNDVGMLKVAAGITDDSLILDKDFAFKGFVNSRHPKFAIRFSERNLKKDGAFVNIPLYLAPRFAACLL